MPACQRVRSSAPTCRPSVSNSISPLLCTSTRGGAGGRSPDPNQGRSLPSDTRHLAGYVALPSSSRAAPGSLSSEWQTPLLLPHGKPPLLADLRGGLHLPSAKDPRGQRGEEISQLVLAGGPAGITDAAPPTATQTHVSSCAALLPPPFAAGPDTYRARVWRRAAHLVTSSPGTPSHQRRDDGGAGPSWAVTARTVAQPPDERQTPTGTGRTVAGSDRTTRKVFHGCSHGCSSPPRSIPFDLPPFPVDCHFSAKVTPSGRNLHTFSGATFLAFWHKEMRFLLSRPIFLVTKCNRN